jgi:WD40 repeat protein
MSYRDITPITAKKLLYVFTLILSMSVACTPATSSIDPQNIPTTVPTVLMPTTTATLDKLRIAIEEVSTKQARYTATPIPSATLEPIPTPTPKYPIAYNQGFPIDPAPIIAENLQKLRLIGTIGEGTRLSTHYNESKDTVVFVYSSFIDIFQRVDDHYALEKSFEIDIFQDNYFFNEWNRRDSYAVSNSARYFAQNYGDRVRVLDLKTGNENTIFVSQADVGGWNFPVQQLFFSPKDSYLLIDSTSDQVLIDLNTLQDALRVETQYGYSNFSPNEDYLLVAKTYESILEVYALPELELIVENTGYSYRNLPGWASITDDQKLVSVGSKFITIWNFPTMEMVYENVMPLEYRDASKVVLTHDNRFLIIGHKLSDKRGVSVWDLSERTLIKFFPINSTFTSYSYSAGDFLLSPNGEHLVVFDQANHIQIFLLEEARILENTRIFQFVKFLETLPFLIFHNGDNFFALDLRENRLINFGESSNFGKAIDLNYFLGFTQTHFFAYDDKYGYINYELSSGNIEIMGTDKEKVKNDTLFDQMELQSPENFLGFREGDQGYRSSYDMLLRKWIDGDLMGGSFQINNQDFSKAIKWGLDSDQLINAVNYIHTSYEPHNSLPHIRNIFSTDHRFKVEFTLNTLEIINIETGDSIRTFSNLGRIYNFKFSADSSEIFIVGSVYPRPRSPVYLKAYEIETGNLIRYLEFVNNPWFYFYGPPFDVSPDGNYLAVGNGEAQVEVIDLQKNWEVLYTLDILNPLCDADIQFSTDSSYLATAAMDDKIQFWKTETGELINEIDVLGGYKLNEYRLVQFYLLDNLVLVARGSFGWLDNIGQIKAFGIIN